jgi:acetyl-CoA/propionyl-CoA carboxylase biotin carboxyl carrier protein
MPTVLPFHRAVVSDPAFATDDETPFAIHTRWIETEFENKIEPYAGAPTADDGATRRTFLIEIDGKRHEVTLPADLQLGGGAAPAQRRAPKRSRSGSSAAAASGDSLTAPMQGTIVKIVVSEGDSVQTGDTVVVLEAMKMEQPITAHRAGTVSRLSATVGQMVPAGAILATITE